MEFDHDKSFGRYQHETTVSDQDEHGKMDNKTRVIEQHKIHKEPVDKYHNDVSILEKQSQQDGSGQLLRNRTSTIEITRKEVAVEYGAGKKRFEESPRHVLQQEKQHKRKKPKTDISTRDTMHVEQIPAFSENYYGNIKCTTFAVQNEVREVQIPIFVDNINAEVTSKKRKRGEQLLALGPSQRKTQREESDNHGNRRNMAGEKNDDIMGIQEKRMQLIEGSRAQEMALLGKMDSRQRGKETTKGRVLEGKTETRNNVQQVNDYSKQLISTRVPEAICQELSRFRRAQQELKQELDKQREAGLNIRKTANYNKSKKALEEDHDQALYSLFSKQFQTEKPEAIVQEINKYDTYENTAKEKQREMLAEHDKQNFEAKALFRKTINSLKAKLETATDEIGKNQNEKNHFLEEDRLAEKIHNRDQLAKQISYQEDKEICRKAKAVNTRRTKLRHSKQDLQSAKGRHIRQINELWKQHYEIQEVPKYVLQPVDKHHIDKIDISTDDTMHVEQTPTLVDNVTYEVTSKKQKRGEQLSAGGPSQKITQREGSDDHDNRRNMTGKNNDDNIGIPEKGSRLLEMTLLERMDSQSFNAEWRGSTTNEEGEIFLPESEEDHSKDIMENKELTDFSLDEPFACLPLETSQVDQVTFTNAVLNTSPRIESKDRSTLDTEEQREGYGENELPTWLQDFLGLEGIGDPVQETVQREEGDSHDSRGGIAGQSNIDIIGTKEHRNIIEGAQEMVPLKRMDTQSSNAEQRGSTTNEESEIFLPESEENHSKDIMENNELTDFSPDHIFAPFQHEGIERDGVMFNDVMLNTPRTEVSKEIVAEVDEHIGMYELNELGRRLQALTLGLEGFGDPVQETTQREEADSHDSRGNMVGQSNDDIIGIPEEPVQLIEATRVQEMGPLRRMEVQSSNAEQRGSPTNEESEIFLPETEGQGHYRDTLENYELTDFSLNEILACFQLKTTEVDKVTFNNAVQNTSPRVESKALMLDAEEQREEYGENELEMRYQDFLALEGIGDPIQETVQRVEGYSHVSRQSIARQSNDDIIGTEEQGQIIEDARVQEMVSMDALSSNADRKDSTPHGYDEISLSETQEEDIKSDSLEANEQSWVQPMGMESQEISVSTEEGLERQESEKRDRNTHMVEAGEEREQEARSNKKQRRLAGVAANITAVYASGTCSWKGRVGNDEKICEDECSVSDDIVSTFSDTSDQCSDIGEINRRETKTDVKPRKRQTTQTSNVDRGDSTTHKKDDIFLTESEAEDSESDSLETNEQSWVQPVDMESHEISVSTEEGLERQENEERDSNTSMVGEDREEREQEARNNGKRRLEGVAKNMIAVYGSGTCSWKGRVGNNEKTSENESSVSDDLVSTCSDTSDQGSDIEETNRCEAKTDGEPRKRQTTQTYNVDREDSTTHKKDDIFLTESEAEDSESDSLETNEQSWVQPMGMESQEISVSTEEGLERQESEKRDRNTLMVETYQEEKETKEDKIHKEKQAMNVMPNYQVNSERRGQHRGMEREESRVIEGKTESRNNDPQFNNYLQQVRSTGAPEAIIQELVGFHEDIRYEKQRLHGIRQSELETINNIDIETNKRVPKWEIAKELQQDPTQQLLAQKMIHTLEESEEKALAQKRKADLRMLEAVHEHQKTMKNLKERHDRALHLLFSQHTRTEQPEAVVQDMNKYDTQRTTAQQKQRERLAEHDKQDCEAKASHDKKIKRLKEKLAVAKLQEEHSLAKKIRNQHASDRYRRSQAKAKKVAMVRRHKSDMISMYNRHIRQNIKLWKQHYEIVPMDRRKPFGKHHGKVALEHGVEQRKRQFEGTSSHVLQEGQHKRKKYKAGISSGDTMHEKQIPMFIKKANDKVITKQQKHREQSFAFVEQVEKVNDEVMFTNQNLEQLPAFVEQANKKKDKKVNIFPLLKTGTQRSEQTHTDERQRKIKATAHQRQVTKKEEQERRMQVETDIHTAKLPFKVQPNETIHRPDSLLTDKITSITGHIINEKVVDKRELLLHLLEVLKKKQKKRQFEESPSHVLQHEEQHKRRKHEANIFTGDKMHVKQLPTFVEGVNEEIPSTKQRQQEQSKHSPLWTKTTTSKMTNKEEQVQIDERQQQSQATSKQRVVNIEKEQETGTTLKADGSTAVLPMKAGPKSPRMIMQEIKDYGSDSVDIDLREFYEHRIVKGKSKKKTKKDPMSPRIIEEMTDYGSDAVGIVKAKPRKRTEKDPKSPRTIMQEIKDYGSDSVDIDLREFYEHRIVKGKSKKKTKKDPMSPRIIEEMTDYGSDAVGIVKAKPRKRTEKDPKSPRTIMQEIKDYGSDSVDIDLREFYEHRIVKGKSKKKTKKDPMSPRIIEEMTDYGSDAVGIVKAKPRKRTEKDPKSPRTIMQEIKDYGSDSVDKDLREFDENRIVKAKPRKRTEKKVDPINPTKRRAVSDGELRELAFKILKHSSKKRKDKSRRTNADQIKLLQARKKQKKANDREIEQREKQKRNADKHLRALQEQQQEEQRSKQKEQRSKQKEQRGDAERKRKGQRRNADKQEEQRRDAERKRKVQRRNADKQEEQRGTAGSCWRRQEEQRRNAEGKQEEKQVAKKQRKASEKEDTRSKNWKAVTAEYKEKYCNTEPEGGAD